MLQAIVGAIEVGIDDSVPALGLHVGQWAHELTTSIIDQVVNTAVLLNSVVHESLHLDRAEWEVKEHHYCK